MFDIHCHVLYGVDDGAKELEDSILMIKKASEVGIKDIILTPHYAPKRHYMASKTDLSDRFEILKETVKKENINVNLYLGNEIDEDKNLLRFLADDVCYTINDTKYVLIDFGMRKIDIDDVLYELVVRGYKPIVAHPERYPYVKSVDEYKKWKSTGALLQLNASSLYGESQVKKKAKLLLKNNLIDFVASDAHRNPKTYEHYDATYKYIIKKHSADLAEKLFKTNAEKLMR